MPGTPLNGNGNGVCGADGMKIEEAVDEVHQVEIQENRGDNQLTTAATREITQNDRLNKRLLESVLERMSKTGEFDKFVEKQENDQEDNDQDKSSF